MCQCSLLRVVFCKPSCWWASGLIVRHAASVGVRGDANCAAVEALESQVRGHRTRFTEVARGLLKSPDSEVTYFSRPLRTPPEASEEKTELTAEAAPAPVSSSASHASPRWRKGGRPLRSRRRPSPPRRGDGSPLRGRRGARVAPQATASLRRQIPAPRSTQ